MFQDQSVHRVQHVGEPENALFVVAPSPLTALAPLQRPSFVVLCILVVDMILHGEKPIFLSANDMQFGGNGSDERIKDERDEKEVRPAAIEPVRPTPPSDLWFLCSISGTNIKHTSLHKRA